MTDHRDDTGTPLDIDDRGIIRNGFGQMIGIYDGRFYGCLHDHNHRTAATFMRCIDGASGAATGSRLAKR